MIQRLLRRTKQVYVRLFRNNFSILIPVPALTKIVINRGVGDAAQNAKLLSFSNELTVLSGQVQ